MRKPSRSKGRNAEFYVINVTANAQPAEFHTGDEFTKEQRDNLRTLLIMNSQSYSNQ
jgi:hypothetical protein